MLFRTVVSLTDRFKLLMKGVAPAAWPVILIVVSSACVASATEAKPTRRSATMRMKPQRIFIRKPRDHVKSGSIMSRKKLGLNCALLLGWSLFLLAFLLERQLVWCRLKARILEPHSDVIRSLCLRKEKASQWFITCAVDS